MKNEITAFINDRVGLKQSPNTIKGYSIDLQQFAEYCAKRNMFDVRNIDNGVVADYISSLSHLEAKSIHRKASTISEFAAWLYRLDKIEKPLAKFKKPKIPSKLRKFLEEHEQNLLLEAVAVHQPRKASKDTTIRDTAMVRLFIDTGLRFSELLNLKLTDLTLNSKEESYITVIGKGNKERKLYISRSYEYVIAWLEYRKTLSYSDSEYLFISERSCRKITDTVFRNTFVHWLDKAGLKGKGITPHTLRHTAATNYYRETGDIRIVQEILGHENINTTSIYAHVVESRIANAMK